MSRSCVQSFDCFQANKIQLHVANLGHARLCGSLAKKEIIVKEISVKEISVERAKLQN